MIFEGFTIISLILTVLSVCLLFASWGLAPLIRAFPSVFKSKTSVDSAPVKSFTIVIPAYNEEEYIEEKIYTLRKALQQTDAEVEVIIGSDGSTDRTFERASTCLEKQGLKNWRLVPFENEGKCSTINKLVGMAKGDVIISTDADIPLPENAIEPIVRTFQSNTRIGCLSCVPFFEGQEIGSQKSYWNIEDNIRRAQSDIGRLIVVTGMLYAYRTELFEKIPKGVMADDLWIPLNVLLKGYDSIQVNDLLVPYEKTDEKTEIYRRKRVIVGGMDVVRRLWPNLLKRPSVLTLVLLHKVNRWASPCWVFILACALTAMFPWVFVLYLFLGALALSLLGKEKVKALFYAGISPILSFVEVMRTKDFARWEHTRKDDKS